MRPNTLLSILLLSTTTAFAQGGKHRIDIGYGLETLDHMRKQPFISNRKTPWPDPIREEAGPLYGLDRSDMSMGAGERTGTLVLSYRYSLLKWLSVGISGCYEQAVHTVYYKERSSGIQSQIGDLKRNVYTIAAELQPVYTRGAWVSWYALLGAGNGFITEKAKDNRTSTSISSSVNETSFQLTPIAIRVGKKLSGHAELGYGYKGIVHAGIGCEF